MNFRIFVNAAMLATGLALGLTSPNTMADLDDKAALALMNKAACAACHSLDKKGVGPSYREVAKKRKGQKDAAAVLAEKVRKGGTGVYGQIPMTANPPNMISDKDLHELIEWILKK
jgi:cytochrome c